MPKDNRQHAWSEEPASGVRRSASSEPSSGGERQGASPGALAGLAALLLASVWLWSWPSVSDGPGASARIVVKRLPSAVAAHTMQLAAAQPAPETQPMIELEVSAWPPEAELVLDGDRLPGNPYSERILADDRIHVLRAVAPGLQSQERAITFDRDRTLRLTLTRASGARAPARAAGRSAQAEAIDPASGARPAGAAGQRTRAIYEEDPYR